MTKARRGVQFPKHSSSHASDARRAGASPSSEKGGLSSPSPPHGNSEAQENEKMANDESPPPSEYEKKKANFITRTLWTFVMIGGFFTLLFMGHIHVLGIVTAIQIICFKEVIAIASVPTKARQLEATKSLNWYWLATTLYFLYGESFIYYLKHIVLVDRVLLPLATHHRFISFLLYVIGFVSFVASLKSGHLKFQFTNFAWTHMALFFIVVQAHFVMNNVFEGLIWFFLPASLVITNDIFAYLCGIAFGRTQLIKLSPKKTVEGFVGAWIMTAIFAGMLTRTLTQYKYFTCPVNDLGANILTGLECDTNPVFLPHTYKFPNVPFLRASTNKALQFTTQPMQIHSMVFATFASLIAPFGGFFASGLKRTFKIKDFGSSIPGHGGMTDRMDCQFIMGCFAYIYYHTFIALHKVNYAHLMEMAITGLTVDEQMELVRGMAKYLENQGAWGSEVINCLDNAIGEASKR